MCKRFDQEYDAYVLPLLDEGMPCYLLFRLDTTNNQGYEWLLLAWSPEGSPVSTTHFLGCGAPLIIIYSNY